MADPGWQAREALATRLRELRGDRTQAEFAQSLGKPWDQTKVSRLEAEARKNKDKAERKSYLPSDADLVAWAAATGADLNELQKLKARAETERYLLRSFKGQYERPRSAAQGQIELAAAEQAAKKIAFYYPLIVAGVLQTSEYAYEMLALDGDPEDEIRHMVAARTRRAAILSEPGRRVTVLVNEATLRLRVAAPQTMRDQCEHIARQATSPATTATIGVVPFSAQLPFAAISAWEILDEIVLVETEEDQTPVADPAQVERYWGWTDALLAVAATGKAAAALCRSIAAEL